MNHSSNARGPGSGGGQRKGAGTERGEREMKRENEKGEGERVLSYGSVDHNFFLPWHLKQEV